MICIFLLVILSAHYISNMVKKYQFIDYVKTSSMKQYEANLEETKTNHLIVSEGKNKKRTKQILKRLNGVKEVKEYKKRYFLAFNSLEEAQSAYHDLESKKDIEVYQDAIVKAQGITERNPSDVLSVKAVENNDHGMKIAIIDTGVNGAGDAVDLTGEGKRDENGHGTTMARIIQQESRQKANVISIKALNKNGYGSIAGLTAAVEYAIDQKVKVIHMSAVAGYKVSAKPLETAIRKATSRGIFVVVSAGNSGINTKHVVPANMKEAIVVSAMDEKGKFARYSNYGDTIDYSAPGSYGNVFGTSYAAAVISGKLLLYGEKEMKMHAYDLGEKGWDAYYGFGSFNVEATAMEETAVPEDNYTDALFDTNRWKKMSDDELNDAFRWHSDYMVARWFQSLSKREQRSLLKRDTWLISDYYDYETKQEMKYFEWLLKQDFAEAQVAAWSTTTGYYNVNISGDGKTSSLKVTVRLGGKSTDSAQTVTFSGVSGSNLHDVSVGPGLDTKNARVTTTQKASVTKKADSDGTSGVNSDGNPIYRAPSYHILTGEITFTKPAYYYATYSSSAKTSAGNNATAPDARFNNKKYNWQNTGESTWVGMNAENFDEKKSFNTQAHGWRMGFSSTTNANPTYELVTVSLKPAKLHVHFHANGGEGNNFEEVYTFVGAVNAESGLPNGSNYFQKRGYHLEEQEAWCLNEDGTDKVFPSNNPSVETLDLTTMESQSREEQSVDVYANWKPNTYTIAYDSNGGKGAMEDTTAVYDQKIELREESFTPPDGKVFAGWNTKANGEGTEYGDLESVENLMDQQNGKIVLYAQWQDGSFNWNERFLDGPEEQEYPTPETLEFIYPVKQAVHIHKIDDYNRPLEGVGFEITCNETGETREVITDQQGNGIVEFEDDIDILKLDRSFFYYTDEEWNSMNEQQQEYVLQTKKHYKDHQSAKEAAILYFKKEAEKIEHTFTIREISGPDYCEQTEEMMVTVSGEKTEDVEVVNHVKVTPLSLSGEVTLTPKFKIRKTKIDQKTVLEGVRLQICDGNGDVLLEGVTDNEGILEYTGKPVHVETREYLYLDHSQALSDTLKQICKENGWYESYELAREAYEKDPNYLVVTCADGGAMREALMTRSYVYRELETLEGLQLDTTEHTATVSWYTSSDVYDNLTEQTGDENPYNPDDEGEEEDSFEFTEEDENVNAEGTYGEMKDYALCLVNEEQPVEETISLKCDYNQKLRLRKIGPKKELLSGATFKVVASDGMELDLNEVEKGIYETCFERSVSIPENQYFYLKNRDEMSEESVEKWIAQAKEGIYRFETEEEAQNAIKEAISQMTKDTTFDYTIKETKAPTGYQINEEKLEVSINGETKEPIEVEMTDEYYGSIQIVKFEDDDKHPLEGVEFSLYCTKDSELDENHPRNELEFKGETYVQIDHKITNENGVLRFEKLDSNPAVKYLVVETKQKEGMEVLTDPIEVGTIPLQSEKSPDSSYKGYYVKQDGMYSYYDIIYKVKNHRVFTMPNTGGKHGYWYAYMAVVCILIGYWMKEKERVLSKGHRRKGRNI